MSLELVKLARPTDLENVGEGRFIETSHGRAYRPDLNAPVRLVGFFGRSELNRIRVIGPATKDQILRLDQSSYEEDPMNPSELVEATRYWGNQEE